MANSEFEKMLDLTNPVESFGLDPTIIRQINGTGGADALRLLYKGVYRAVASATHPDRNNAEVPEIFREVTESMDRISSMSDKDLVDYSLAIGNKKRRKANKEIVYTETPLMTEMVTRLSEDIIEGRLSNETLQKTFRFEIKDQYPLQVFQHNPDSPLLLIGESETVDAQDINNNLSPEKQDAIKNDRFWDMLHSSVHILPTLEKRGEKNRSEYKSAVLDGTTNGITRVLSPEDGSLIAELPQIDELLGFSAAVSRTRKIYTDPDTGENSYAENSDIAFKDLHHFSFRGEAESTNIMLLGALSPEYMKVFEAFINEKRTEAEGIQFAGKLEWGKSSKNSDPHDQLKDRLLKPEYKHQLMNHHLETVQRQRLAEYFESEISHGSLVFGKDIQTGELRIVGTAVGIFR